MSFFNRLSKGKDKGSSNGPLPGEKTGTSASPEKPSTTPSGASTSKSVSSFFGAATKPLKTRRVTEQTRELIVAHKDLPLTDHTAGKFWGFFTNENSSEDTRNLVILQFVDHAKRSEVEAHVVAAFVRAEPAAFESLYDAALPKTRAYMALLIAYLATYESTSRTALGMKPCARLLRLCSDTDLEVRDSALFALLKISVYPEGAQMLVSANVLLRAPDFLRSSIPNERIKICNIVANVAKHEQCAPAVLSLKMESLLVTLTSDANNVVHRDSLLALAQISQWPAGRQTIRDTTLLERTQILLSSPEPVARAHMCQILGRLCIKPEDAAVAVLLINPCEQLVSLISDTNKDVSRLSLFALAKLSSIAGGALPVASAGAAQFALQTLEPSNQSSAEHRRWAFEILTNLGQNDATMPLVLATSATRTLVGLLDTPSLQHNALVVLVDQVKWSDGAEMAVKSGIIKHARRLVAAPDLPFSVRFMSIQIIEDIVGHQSLMADVLAAEPCPALVGLLADAEITLRRRALCALGQIAADTDGAQALVEADMLAYIPALLDSREADMQQLACGLLGMLAKDESTCLAVLSINPCERLIELASAGINPEVCTVAILALTMFCFWPDGAEAVGAANMAKQDKPNITLRVVSDGALWCGIAIDVPAEVTREDAETSSSNLGIPFPFREIRLWPQGDALTIDPPEFMKVAELLAALSLGAAEGQGFAVMHLKHLVIYLLKVQGWEYPFQIHERYRTLARVLFLAINSPPHTEDQMRERQARDIEDEAICRLRDILVEHAGDIDGGDVGFAACSVLVNLVRRERLDGQAGDSNLISNHL